MESLYYTVGISFPDGPVTMSANGILVKRVLGFVLRLRPDR